MDITVNMSSEEIDALWETLTEREREELVAEHNAQVDDEVAMYARHGGEL